MSPDANPFADAQFQDPEYLDFVVHREKKEITLPSGFNSAEFIKDEVTRQLQAVHRYCGSNRWSAERPNSP